MGCDIHCFTEVKLSDQWVFVHKTKIDRDYRLFGVLAGVRHSGQCFPRKGKPKDVSVLVQHKMDYWGGDSHSHSWVSIQELEIVLGDKPYLRQLLSPFLEDYRLFTDCEMDIDFNFVQGVRWVFFFDN